jgi:hypothetical protein
MRLSPARFLAVVRASAAYDLLLTAPFVTPWSFAIAHGQLSTLNVALGGAALPVFGPFHLLFAGLMASVVLVWSVLRLRAPSIALGRYDGCARCLFALWMARTLAVTGTPLMWVFVVPEAAWAVAQWWPVDGRPRHA